MADTATLDDELVTCTETFYNGMARRVRDECVVWGWTPPFFEANPPGDAPRTLRRGTNGDVAVSVRLDRPAGLIAHDMVAGTIAANKNTRPAMAMSVEAVELELLRSAFGL